jgi:hypothetical protein
MALAKRYSTGTMRVKADIGNVWVPGRGRLKSISATTRVGFQFWQFRRFWQFWQSPSCGPLPASFSQRPTPHMTFVENKSQTSIRPSGHRAVEALFSRSSGLQSLSISALFSRSMCSVGRGSQLSKAARRKLGPPTNPVLAWRGGIPPRFRLSS